MKCQISVQYGKDDNKQLHFYCDYCGKEMDYNEDRECLFIRERCPHCKAEIGNAEMSVGACFSCDKDL